MVCGGVIAHADGITLSQPLGETNALIKAPGAHGVNIRNQPGARTDYRGYTVVSNISVYRKNDLTLDPQNMPEDVELEINTDTVTPTRGAVVRADYLSKVGRRVLMTLPTINRFVPFGAVVTLADDNKSSFIVGRSRPGFFKRNARAGGDRRHVGPPVQPTVPC